ncbi:dachshund homolog 2-like isoform X2 [Melanotaenia boesemani]|uniref:dachshund homolog 2-like isoform X2 n=1 Tax=Melanotaenia boesemani TaxID=1250792 RepID=UPI001C04EE88|nr:dachshund homolog 2-like isoform X2 [Melanotaenia boesemani]
MAGSSTDPIFHSDLTYSAPYPASSPRLPAAFLSGRVPLGMHGVSGGAGGAGGGAAPQTECRMVEVHGVKVASFTVDGAELICLPQVFQLFLKHLVGGLHTIYTKLKRLDISPVVCTVEQVRVLRGLGAIQPGVNRCKLITRTDFETLYLDCTTASSRPGRPPKRTLGVANMTNCSRLLPQGLISPALLSQTGLTAAAMVEALKLQKMRMMMCFHDKGGSEESWEKKQHLLSTPSSGVAPPAGSLHFNTLQQHSSLLANRLSDLPFMVMSHPLLPVGLPPVSVALAINQMSQISSLADMATTAKMVENKESPTESSSPCPSYNEDEIQPGEPTSQSPSRASSLSSSSHPSLTHTPELDETMLPHPLLRPAYQKPPISSQPLSVNQTNRGFVPLLTGEGLSSMETLLTNIQGLLKVAEQSARFQDKHSQLERKELKMELDREQDARRTLQRQLSCELQRQVLMQKKLKKEKKVKRKLQEELGMRRRGQVETSLKHPDWCPADVMTPESVGGNKLRENSGAPENRAFTTPPLLL